MSNIVLANHQIARSTFSSATMYMLKYLCHCTLTLEPLAIAARSHGWYNNFLTANKNGACDIRSLLFSCNTALIRTLQLNLTNDHKSLYTGVKKLMTS